jgi:hypothetical protein
MLWAGEPQEPQPQACEDKPAPQSWDHRFLIFSVGYLPARCLLRSRLPRSGRSCTTPGSIPRPRRTGPTWKQLLTAQARGIIAVDSYPAIVDQPRRAPDPRKQILGGLTSEYQIAA